VKVPGVLGPTQTANREVAVVQFPHPRREWGPARGTLQRDWTDWNDGHGRKFLLHPGAYLDEHGSLTEGAITFWGEWEGPSTFLATGAIGDGLPAWVQIPRRGDLTNVLRPQNTDPFVFGSFLYSNCMQDHEWPKSSGIYRRTAMSRLAPGSVVLFGSTQGGNFVLDTCFVVGEVIEIDNHHFEEQVRDRVPDALIDATLRPIFVGVGSRQLSLYIGVQYGAGQEMFSFFPCSSNHSGPVAFKRPTLTPEGALKEALNPRSSRRFRRHVCDLSSAVAAWNEVKRQVLESDGVRLGVYAKAL
jgi:hypothetical protein